MRLFQKIESAIKQYSSNSVLVVGEGWNCTTEESHPQSADKLSSLITASHLLDVWRDRNEKVKRYTCVKVGEGLKSEAFIMGQRREGGPHVLPGSLQWSKDGITCLGVYLGSNRDQARNWERLVDKVCGKLSKWTWFQFQPQLSYRGRVLVANNLIASMLWHKLWYLIHMGLLKLVLTDLC